MKDANEYYLRQFEREQDEICKHEERIEEIKVECEDTATGRLMAITPDDMHDMFNELYSDADKLSHGDKLLNSLAKKLAGHAKNQNTFSARDLGLAFYDYIKYNTVRDEFSDVARDNPFFDSYADFEDL